MELLQSGRYKDKPGEIAEFYLHDIKTQIESMLELCQEGEFSTFEVAITIDIEKDCSHDFQDDLLNMLNDLEEGVIKPRISILKSECFPETNEEKEIADEINRTWSFLFRQRLSEPSAFAVQTAGRFFKLLLLLYIKSSFIQLLIKISQVFYKDNHIFISLT